MKTQVIVTPVDKRSIHRVLGMVGGLKFRWAYLGRSSAEFGRISSHLEAQGEWIDTSPNLREVSEFLRRSYLSYLYRVGEKLDSLLWWLTTLSYRSVYVSPTYLYICLLKVGLDQIERQERGGCIVLFVHSYHLRLALKANIPDHEEIDVDFIEPKFSNIRTPGRDWLALLARRAFFLYRESKRMFWARRVTSQGNPPKNPSTLIISSLSPRNVHLGPDFITFFFAELAQKLCSWGKDVVLMPLVLLTIPYKTSLIQVLRTSFPILVPHRYVTVSDLIRSALSTLRKPPAPTVFMPFSGMDINKLLQEDLRVNWMGNGSADALFLAAALRRMAESGLNLNRIIYIYENQPWERAVCTEARRSFPNAVLIGYQHSRAPRMLHNLHVAPGGEEKAPNPDIVVTAGAHTSKTFKSDGWAPNRIRTGSAFLSNRRSATPSKPIGEPIDVLVAPSHDHWEAADLVNIVIDVADDLKDLRIVVKPHPSMPLSTIGKYLYREIPDSIQYEDEDIRVLMASSQLMLYTSSTVCIEALEMGIPMVHFQPRFGLDLDPLEDNHQCRLDASNIGELKDQIRWLLKNRESYIDSRKSMWERTSEEIHGNATDESYTVFSR